jgi:hypothetical protein
VTQRRSKRVLRLEATTDSLPEARAVDVDVAKIRFFDALPGWLVARTQVKVFVKTVNVNHLLLTRHQLKDEDFSTKIKPDAIVQALKDQNEKKAALDGAAAALRQKYLNNKFPWLFKPLQF